MTIQPKETPIQWTVSIKPEVELVNLSSAEYGTEYEQIFQIKNAQQGNYLVEFSADQDSEAVVRVCTDLPTVNIGQLFVGTIYHDGGCDWTQMDVPDGLGALEFTVETVGIISNLDVWRGSFGSEEHWQAELLEPPMKLTIPDPESGRYYLRVCDHGLFADSQIRDYSIFVEALQPSIEIDNEILHAEIDQNRAGLTSLIFKKGSARELIATNSGHCLMDLGADEQLGRHLQRGWSLEQSEEGPGYRKLVFSHYSGFGNEMVLVWDQNGVHVSSDFTAPESVSAHSALSPGGGCEWGQDKWAYPTAEGVQVGDFGYPGYDSPLYPPDDSWGTPAERWIALWDEQVDEVYGYTFSGDVKFNIRETETADQYILIPGGTSSVAFHVVKPKPVTAYEAIRGLIQMPNLRLTKQVSPLFAGAGAELTYTLTYSNTGDTDATGVVLEDTLPDSLELVSGSITGGGTYDAATRGIIWNLGTVAAAADEQTVTFTAEIQSGLAEGAQIVNTAGIWSAERLAPTMATATTTVGTPQISSISPDQGADTGSVTVTINGQYLDPNAEVRLSKLDETDIVAAFVAGSSEGTILTATFGLRQKTPGVWDLSITNPASASTMQESAFVIAGGGTTNLWLRLVGRTTLRVGRPSTLLLAYGNDGTVAAVCPAIYLSGLEHCTIEVDLPVVEGDFALPNPSLTTPGPLVSEEGADLYILPGIVHPGSERQFNVTITPHQTGESKLVAQVLTAGAATVQQTHFPVAPSSTTPNLIIPVPYPAGPGGGWWYPPECRGDDMPSKGSTVIRLSEGGGTGHVAIYIGDGLAVELMKDTKTGEYYVQTVNIWEKWLGDGSDQDMGLYVGAWDPPGMTDDIRNEIVKNAMDRVGERGDYGVIPFGEKKNCIEFVQEQYDYDEDDKVGIPTWWNDFTTPGAIYEAESYQRWPEGRGGWWLLAPSAWPNPFMLGYSETIAQFIEMMFVTSYDPNEKLSPVGFGAGHVMPPGAQLSYFVHFENDPEKATAAVQDMLLTDQLDSNLDWSTFAFGDIQVGTHAVSVPDGNLDFSTEIDFRPEMPVIVQVRCSFDAATGAAEWYFKGADPYTGVFADFLPPNTEEVAPRGEGWVSYSVKPKPNLPTSTVIPNTATIDFEVDIPPEPMDTPEVFNTIDSGPPASQVEPLSETQGTVQFDVSWTGQDDENGSGIGSYTIYVSADGGAYQAWLANTTDTSATFTAEAQHTYAFHSVARDNVGNREAPPDQPDATTTVGVVRHTFSAGQRMIGIPAAVPGSPMMEDLLGIAQDKVGWWDPQGPGYVTFDAPTEYGLGCGYWADFGDETEAEIAGTAVTGEFTYDVQDGWNIVSNPYASEIGLESITGAPTLRPFAWTDQGNGYELVAPLDGGLTPIHNTLQPWWGYWVLSEGDGTVTWNPTSPTAQDVELLQMGKADAEQGGWQIQLTAKAGERVDLCNYCGVADEETAQTLRIANPPAISGSVDLYFPSQAGPMAIDIRPTTQDELTWEFEVRTDLADTEVTVAYPDLSVVPNDCRLMLTDLDADKSTYMRTTHGYSYNSGPQGGVRHLRITAEPKSEASLLVTGVTAQQVSSQQAAITYTLSAAAQIDIQIRNIAGRVIRRMQSDKLQASGSHTANWNLANTTGSRVPAGTYLCIITARTEEGQQASCLRTIAVIR